MVFLLFGYSRPMRDGFLLFVVFLCLWFMVSFVYGWVLFVVYYLVAPALCGIVGLGL